MERIRQIPLLILLNKCEKSDSDGLIKQNGYKDEQKEDGCQGTSCIVEDNRVSQIRSPSPGGWQSFELDNEWEVSSNCSSYPISTPISEKIRIELQERFGSIHYADLAIISISVC